MLRQAGAYLPAVARDAGTKVAELLADEDVLEAVERVDLVAFGEKGATNARPGDVDRQLTDAISAGNPAAVAAALAAGADPHRPPGLSTDALEFALFCLTSGKALLPDRLAVVELVLATGAGGPHVPLEADRRDAWWRKRKRDELTNIFRQHWTIDGHEPELDLPASRPGEKVPATVEPRAFNRWSNPRRRDTQAAALEATGFTRVGEFGILQCPEIRMLVLHHYDLRAFAVVSEYQSWGWAEIVRWHGDGSALTVGNPEHLTPEFVHDTPGHRKVLEPRWGVNKLVDFLRNEPPPPGSSVMLVRAKEFKARFEHYYGEELGARRMG